MMAEDFTPEGFEKSQDPERYADRGGLPWDELDPGMFVTILKNKTSLIPMIMGGLPPIGSPGMNQGGADIEGDYAISQGGNHESEKMKHLMNYLKSMSEDYSGGGALLRVMAVNRPYVIVNVWDSIGKQWIDRPITKDLRLTTFIRVKESFARALGATK